MNQIDIFDLIPKQLPIDVPCGYIDDPDLLGREIPFPDLKNYIGKKVVKAYEGGYKVYKVIEYIENCDTYYKRVRPIPDNAFHYDEYVNEYIYSVVGQKAAMACYEAAFTCDRIALSDKEGSEQANAWTSETYCKGGKYPIFPQATGCAFHELLTASTQTEYN